MRIQHMVDRATQGSAAVAAVHLLSDCRLHCANNSTLAGRQAGDTRPLQARRSRNTAPCKLLLLLLCVCCLLTSCTVFVLLLLLLLLAAEGLLASGW
jgi:hypothetical protein